jgi:two-component system, cell cycle response regulator
MVRVLLVDDSGAVRGVIASRLRDQGYEVEEAADGVAGAELALEHPPDVVVTDLWMPGLSGVQVCRLLRSEPLTQNIPVILVTGESDRRSRFWARTAGAAAYVAKTDSQALLNALDALGPLPPRAPPGPPNQKRRGSIHERLSARLDAALFESVVAGEVRSLAQSDGDAELVFSGLVQLVSEIAGYRWLALVTHPAGRLFIHACPEAREMCESEARAALGVVNAEPTFSVLDDRALLGRPSPPIVAQVRLGATMAGVLAMGPSERGASSEDKQLVAIIARELGGPLRIVSLVDAARHLAMTDPLTGLLNRRAFVEAMSREIARAARHEHPLSVMLLDVDHFKKVNDTRGHEAGDVVLRGVAEIAQRIARKSDIVARWGGEEFVVGLPHAAEAGARVAAERLRRAIAEASFALSEGAPVRVTASVCVAYSAAGENLELVVARADQAMYFAKSRGRNRVETNETGGPRTP